MFFGGRDGHLYAVSLADGRQLWKSAPMRQITAAPVAGASTVCVQAYYGTTQAFDAETGAPLWRANLGGSLGSTPVITADLVYLATYQGVVYALR